ncbi:MAG: NAD-dependent DNA ligase LigA, partial [Oscillospiraceae bacterium]|nr:NAD-dependent DNA ligase LigA [Oscillospiraceae bacterium]
MADNIRNDIVKRVDFLNEARRAYEQEDREIISNEEYDRLLDELADLEKKTGIVLSNSPTVNVGYEVLSSLPKERHEQPMLSLDKTKEPEALSAWLGDHEGLLSWKLDGLTVVLTYEGGKLTKAVTRGNGETGEVITNNANVFEGLPVSIPYNGKLIVRGEAVIKYSDFERINREIEDVEAKYKNPRNLCSGTVRQLDNSITAARHVNFVAFALVETEPAVDFSDRRKEQFKWLDTLGFTTVFYREVDSTDVVDAVKIFAVEI